MKQVNARFQKYESYFAQQNKEYFEQKVFTIKEYEQQKMLDCKQITVIQLESIISKVKKYYKYLGYLNYIAFHVISFVEKIKNLITWYHYQKTYMCIVFAFIAIVVYLVIPFNLVFAVLIISRCIKGRKFYQKTKIHNSLLIKSFISEIIKKFFQGKIVLIKQNINLFQFCKEFSENLRHPDREWSQSMYTFPSLNKKIVEQLTQNLKFKVKDDLLNQYKTMNQLCSYLSSTHNPLFLSKALLCNEYKTIPDKEKFMKKTSKFKKILSYIYYFFYNIPSDYYRVIHPQQY